MKTEGQLIVQNYPKVTRWCYPRLVQGYHLSSDVCLFIQSPVICGCGGGIAALEAGSGVSEGLLGGMSIPMGMTRRALNYDDNLEQPMSSPPNDINITNLWRRPIVPERKFSRLAEVLCLL